MELREFYQMYQFYASVLESSGMKMAAKLDPDGVFGQTHDRVLKGDMNTLEDWNKMIKKLESFKK